MNSDSESAADAEASSSRGSSPRFPGHSQTRSAESDPLVSAAGLRAARTTGRGARARPPPTSGLRYTFSSLNNRDYLFLWLGMLCLMGGVQMQMIARSYLVYDITSRPLLLGVVNAGSAVPILALSLYGGAIADRVDRKRLIQMGQLGSMILALVIGVSIATGAVTWVHLLIASMIQGGLWSFMMPARQAIIPEIVGQENLTNGLALSAAGMSAMTLLSPAAAGTLYAALGPEGVYLVIAVLGFLAVAFTTLVRYEGTGRAKPGAALLKDIGEGLSYVARSPMVLVLLLMGLATTTLAMPFRFLIPVFVVDIYERGPEALGLLVSVMGVGSLAGAIAITSLGRWRRGLLMILGSFMSGAGLLMVAAFPYYLAAAGIMLLLGLGDATRRTLNQTLIMEVVEDRYRGRVMSLFMMNFGLMPLAVLPAGLAIEVFGGETTVAVLGAGVLVVTTAFLVTQKRLREFQ